MPVRTCGSYRRQANATSWPNEVRCCPSKTRLRSWPNRGKNRSLQIKTRTRRFTLSSQLTNETPPGEQACPADEPERARYAANEFAGANTGRPCFKALAKLGSLLAVSHSQRSFAWRQIIESAHPSQ